MESILCPPGKHAWPELVGKNGEEAAEIIKKENPEVTPIVWDKPWIPLDYNVIGFCHC
ncbi:Trypsin/subtilisin inhibitor [Bienertia sinuspersici]